MLPAEDLKNEHHVIGHVIAGMREAGLKFQIGGTIPTDLLEQAIDFMENFTSRCHHAKEERVLLPALAQRGLALDHQPAAGILREHEKGRDLLARIVADLDVYRRGETPAGLALGSDIREFVELLTQHIRKENLIFPKLINDLLSADEQAEVEAGFARIEQEIGKDEYDRYVRLARDLDHQLKAA